ncbi:MAG: WYL domain-containing protein [Bacteroidetes bacterium]|nr:MAG: WYL domain-containing protein [Bacteroidota bacterium]
MPDPDTRTALLLVLGTGAELTQAELAHRLRVTDRTVRRHLTALARDGLVEARRDGLLKRFRLVPGAHPLPPLPVRLSEEEAEALTVAALAARSLLAPTPFDRPLAAAARRFAQAWLAEVFSFEPETESEVWDFSHPDGPPAPFDPVLFRTLLTSVRERTPVEADYYTASRRQLSSGRRLHPLGFYVRGGSWLLAAWCCRDGRVKDFALAGFRSVRPLTGTHFDPPKDFDLHLHARDRFRAVAGDAVYTVRVAVKPEILPYFHRKVYHPTQQIEAEHPDGSAVVSFEVEGLDEIAAWCRSWGPRIRVLEPSILVEQVARAHAEAARQYERPDPESP